MSKPKTKPVLEFTIDRSKWRRTVTNGPPQENALVNRDGTQCCLGFFVRACGIKKAEAVGVGFPSAVDLQAKKHPEVYEKVASMEDEFASLNDNKNALTGKDLEKAIAHNFATCGAKVTFTGKTPRNPEWASKAGD